jgi:uncharacterized protein (TIGR02271 family)
MVLVARLSMEQKDIRDNIENSSDDRNTVIPVIHEQVTVSKETVNSNKVHIRKRVTEEVANVNIPLINEGYDIKKVPVKKIVDAPPPVRQEGDTTIIPVVQEVLIIEKRYEIVEEVHVIKRKEEVPFTQQVSLLKEHVEVERIPIDQPKKDH